MKWNKKNVFLYWYKLGKHKQELKKEVICNVSVCHAANFLFLTSVFTCLLWSHPGEICTVLPGNCTFQGLVFFFPQRTVMTQQDNSRPNGFPPFFLQEVKAWASFI